MLTRMDDLTKLELANLRELIALTDRRYSEQALARDDALKSAFAANDRRLAGMNEFRSALSDQAAGMMTRREADVHRDGMLDKIEQQRLQMETRLNNTVQPMTIKLDEITKPNWALTVSLVSMFLVMAAGVWLVIGLQITAATAPILLATEQSKIEIRTSEAKLNQLEDGARGYGQAATDLSHLRQDYTTIVERIGTMRADIARENAALVEVETQFCAADIMRNLNQANDSRFLSLLWQKAFIDGTRLPTDNAYYPVICNRNTKAKAGDN